MKDLRGLYNSISNPIESYSCWRKIIEVYSASRNYHEFLDKTTNTGDKDSCDKLDMNDKSLLYLLIWNAFKTNIINTSEDRINYLIEKNIVDEDIRIVISKIKNIDVNEDNVDINSYNNDLLIHKYFSKFLNETKEYIDVSSNIERPNNMYWFLTINMHHVDTFRFSIEFIKACISEGLQFYFRVTNQTSKDDSIVIYSNGDNINEYIHILNSLKKENSKSFSKSLRANIYTSKIKDWIGIAATTSVSVMEFNDNRASTIFKSLDSVMFDYVVNKRNSIVSYKSGKLNLEDYVCSFASEEIVNRRFKIDLLDGAYVSNMEEMLELKEELKNKISEKIGDIFKNKLRDVPYHEVAVIKTKMGEDIIVKMEELMYAIRKLTPTLIIKDRILEAAFKVRIRNECYFKGIDSDTFCVDRVIKNSIFEDSEKYNKIKSRLDEMNKVREKIEKITSYKDSPDDEKKEEKRKEIYDDFQDLFKILDEDKRDLVGVVGVENE